MSFIDLSPQDKQALLHLARYAIAHFLKTHTAPDIDIEDYPHSLRQTGASFVTLTHADGELRGCIGSIEAHRALVQDVADNAIGAAVRDPRFPPVSRQALAALRIELSILTPLRKIDADNEEALLTQLQPGIDGVALYDGMNRATFLPKVWEKINNKREFIEQLRRKAGIDSQRWSEASTFYCYRAVDFGER